MDSRSSYKAHRMIFPSQEVFSLIKDFDKSLTPLFEDVNYKTNIFFISREYLTALRNDKRKYKKIPKDYCINENHYMKILMKLFYILIKLEDSAPIIIKNKLDNYFGEGKFGGAFPNIKRLCFDMHYFSIKCPRDIDDGTLDFDGILYTVGTLHEICERLREIGVCPPGY